MDGVPVKCDGPRTYRAERIEETFKMTISSLLKQLEALPVETILEYKYQIAQLKYCGLNQIFTSGTMKEKKMLLSILVRRVEMGRGDGLNIQPAPSFEQFLDGLIEMR